MVPSDTRLQNSPMCNFEDLGKAFVTFNEAAGKVQEYYNFLEMRVEELKVELEQKNKTLEQNLIEKENLSNYFKNVLESLNVGIVGMRKDGRITFTNSNVYKLFNID